MTKTKKPCIHFATKIVCIDCDEILVRQYLNTNHPENVISISRNFMSPERSQLTAAEKRGAERVIEAIPTGFTKANNDIALVSWLRKKFIIDV